jgi:hypothetical protein
LTRIDPSVPAAIGRAAREVRASDVVVGWTPRSDAQELFFGSMIDKLIQATDTAVVVGRIRETLPGTKRLLLVVPPHAEREPMFASAALRAAQLAKVLSAPVTVVTPEGRQRGVAKRLKAAKIADPAKWLPAKEWSRVSRLLRETVKPDDLVAIVGARPGSLSWTPGTAALPRRVAHLLPDVNLLVIYPAEQQPEQAFIGPLPPRTMRKPSEHDDEAAALADEDEQTPRPAPTARI